MLVAQLTLAGCLGLKKNIYISPIAIILPIATWLYTGSLSNAYNTRGKFLTAQKAAQLDDGIDMNADPSDIEIGPDGKYRMSQHDVLEGQDSGADDSDVAPPASSDAPGAAAGGKRFLKKQLSGVFGGITSAVSAIKGVAGLGKHLVAADTDDKVPAPHDAYGKELDHLVHAKPGSADQGAVHGSFGFAAGGRIAAQRAADEGLLVIDNKAVSVGASSSGDPVADAADQDGILVDAIPAKYQSTAETAVDLAPPAAESGLRSQPAGVMLSGHPKLLQESQI